MLHSEVLPSHTLALLKALSAELAGNGFYLAGGTALALRFGHRESVDLDFFSEHPFDAAEMLARIKIASKITPIISQQTPGSVCISLEGCKVELFHYPYPLLSKVEKLEGITFCSLKDNAAMKMSALTNRGSKKDFIDVAALLEVDHLKTWLAHFEEKYPDTDVFTVIKSLTWFEDAEMEPEPKLLYPQSWESIKCKISEAVVSLEK